MIVPSRHYTRATRKPEIITVRIVVRHRGAYVLAPSPTKFFTIALNSSCNYAYYVAGSDHRESAICMEFSLQKYRLRANI